jgi:hypothetical protein
VTKKKYLTILSVAIVSVLLGSLLVNNMLMAQTDSHEYDPWIDLNDDGDIDWFDFGIFAQAYGTSGTPINKTALVELESRVDALETRIEVLENKSGFLPPPAFDSGWIPLSVGTVTTIYHWLGTTEVLVYMTANNTGGFEVHQRYYGLITMGLPDEWKGAIWQDLTEDSITIYRAARDGIWDKVRVQIWKISEP